MRGDNDGNDNGNDGADVSRVYGYTATSNRIDYRQEWFRCKKF